MKALNTLTAALMVEPKRLANGEHTVFVSCDDEAAKAAVTELLVSFGHTDVIDLGDITTARGTEMLLPIWLRLVGKFGNAEFNFKVVRLTGSQTRGRTDRVIFAACQYRGEPAR